MEATTDSGGYGPDVNIFDLDPETSRHPQEMYRALRDTAPVVSLDGIGHVLTTREAAQECFRQPELVAPVARLVHERIDAFIDRGECDFSTEFSVPLPSEVFLTLLGLPLSDLATFLKMKDGVIR